MSRLKAFEFDKVKHIKQRRLYYVVGHDVAKGTFVLERPNGFGRRTVRAEVLEREFRGVA